MAAVRGLDDKRVRHAAALVCGVRTAGCWRRCHDSEQRYGGDAPTRGGTLIPAVAINRARLIDISPLAAAAWNYQGSGLLRLRIAAKTSRGVDDSDFDVLLL